MRWLVELDEHESGKKLRGWDVLAVRRQHGNRVHHVGSGESSDACQCIELRRNAHCEIKMELIPQQKSKVMSAVMFRWFRLVLAGCFVFSSPADLQ
jgi:hypothetical protein